MKKIAEHCCLTGLIILVTRNIKVFSVDSLKAHEDLVYASFKEKLDDVTYQRSIALGDTIAKVKKPGGRNRLAGTCFVPNYYECCL